MCRSVFRVGKVQYNILSENKLRFTKALDDMFCVTQQTFSSNEWGALGAGNMEGSCHCLFAYTTHIVMIQCWLEIGKVSL